MDEGTRRRYRGASGQMAVMAELLTRGINVAVPEVDSGEDVFAFADGRRPVDRIQVKRATAIKSPQGDGYSANVNLALKQLESIDDPELYYIFAVRLEERWVDFVVISRYALNALYENESIGSIDKTNDTLKLHLTFGRDSLSCSGCDFNSHRNAWNVLPVLCYPTNGDA